jgi:hypothetical protein
MVRKIILCIGAVLILSCPLILDAGCTSYFNSFPSYIGGQSVCAGSGPGCTECIDESGGACVTSGSYCKGPFQQT